MLEIKEFSDFENKEMLSDLASMHSAIFEEDIHPILNRMAPYENKIILIAYVEGNPAGYKIGYTLPDQNNEVFYSWVGGVLPEYRGMGIASKLMEHQHNRCKELGIHTVETKSRDKWANMISLNKKFGFELVEEYIGKNCGTKKYLFRKHLG